MQTCFSRHFSCHHIRELYRDKQWYGKNDCNRIFCHIILCALRSSDAADGSPTRHYTAEQPLRARIAEAIVNNSSDDEFKWFGFKVSVD